MTTLEAPRVDDETTVLDETAFKDIIPCIVCAKPAEVIVTTKCCGHIEFGCARCEARWEAIVRGQYMLAPLFGNQPRCGQCHAHHERFEDNFAVESI